MTTTIDSVEIPSLILKEGTAPSTPAAGDQRLFIDSADHLLKYKNSAGVVTAVGGGGASSPLTTKGDIWGFSSVDARVPVGSNGQVLTADSAQTLGIKWAAGGGGGGTHSYLGYNTVGGSQETITNHRIYAKKVTVAADGMLLSIGAHIENASDTIWGMGVALYSDTAGAPDQLLAFNPATSGSGGSETGMYLTATATPTYPPAGWMHLPIGLFCPAADYWIAVLIQCQSGGTFKLSYDGSGTDRRMDATVGAGAFAPWGRYSPTTTSNKYSLRASVLS